MEEVTRDLKDVIKTIKKRYRMILSMFFGCVALALLISFIVPPTYEAKTNLRIKQPKGLANSLLGDLPAELPGETKQQISTYAEILKSPTVVQEVIAKTQADKEKIPTYEDMLNRITTEPVKDTEILRVKVQAATAEEAQLVANTLVDIFMGRIKAEQGVVRELIGQRLQESKNDLERAETALEQYKRTAKIVAPDEQTKAAVNRFSDLAKLQAENAVAQVTAQARLVSIDQQLASEKPGFVADSPLIQQYKAKLAELEVNMAALLEKYTEKHPEVIATRAAIMETKGKLDAESVKVINAEAPSLNPVHQGLLQNKIQSEAELAAASAQKQAIERVLAADEEQLMNLPAKEQGLAKVMRDVSVAQEIYTMLAKRHEEARISEALQPADVQVLDVADIPRKPVKPNKALNVAIAGFLGIFAGLAWALFQAYMNKAICTPGDVRQYLELPVLGKIINIETDNYKSILQKQVKSPVGEAYRTLWTNMLFSKGDQAPKSIMFTSTGPGEGKSITVANTAVALAQSGKKVIVLDCDLRKPVQHEIFGKASKGLTNVLVEDLTVQQLLAATDIAGLQLLPSGSISPNPLELLSGKKMLDVLDDLRSRADYVIIDAPSVSAVADACVLASRVDGICLVVGAGTTRPEMAQEAKELLLNAKGHILGVILNRMEIEEDAAYYYYYESETRRSKKRRA